MKWISQKDPIGRLQGDSDFPFGAILVSSGVVLRDTIYADKEGDHEEKDFFMGVFVDPCAAFVIYPIYLGR